MAFQFQAVAALAPVYMHRFDVALADIGLLIGLYLSPGLVIALPGGAIGRRFGDRSAVAVGMALMVAGALAMLLIPTWSGQIFGRLLAGIGGVVLNVLMSKMVTDHFSGREIGTAMGIFVNSWPVGIAAALLCLPLLGGADDPMPAQAVVLGVTLAGLALFLAGTPPAPAGGAAAVPAVPLRGAPLAATLAAGSIWGLYNGALGMVFGFGPAMLVERGWALAAASASTSLVLWVAAVSIPLGGYLSDRTGRRDLVMVLGFGGFAAALLLAPDAGSVIPLFVLLGVFAGLSAGPIMSLPAAVLAPGNRALGMGVFFTMFYAGVVFAPMLAGLLSEASGTSKTAFHLGAAMLGLCGLALWMFRTLVDRLPAEARLRP